MPPGVALPSPHTSGSMKRCAAGLRCRAHATRDREALFHVGISHHASFCHCLWPAVIQLAMNAFGCCLQQRLSWDIVFEASDTAKPFELLHVAVRQIPRSVVPTTIFTFIWVCEHCNMANSGPCSQAGVTHIGLGLVSEASHLEGGPKTLQREAIFKDSTPCLHHHRFQAGGLGQGLAASTCYHPSLAIQQVT